MLEYCEFGDLRQLVATCKRKAISISVAEFGTLLTQTAEGMRYIESQRILHMDLAARNVYVPKCHMPALYFGPNAQDKHSIDCFANEISAKLLI